MQYRVCELAFEAESVPTNPWTQVDLSVRFTGPEGQVLDVTGFFDGGKTWKVRFCPPSAGLWTYATRCDDATGKLGGRKGNLVAMAADGDNPLYLHGGILKVSANARHLTYTDGTPFFWLGDTWWFCPSDLVPIDASSQSGCTSTYRKLIDTRASQGYTTVNMAFLSDIEKADTLTFISARTSGRFDPGYWRKVDRYMDYANQKGIVPVLGIRWGEELMDGSLEDWRFLWKYVVARYGSHAVTWLICGEYNMAKKPGQEERIIELGRFIRKVDPYRRAMTVHPSWYGGDKHQAWSEPWCDFIMFQGGHLNHGEAPPLKLYLDAYQRLQPKPLMECECAYEGIYTGRHTLFPDRKELTADDVRRVAYQSVQCGGFGFTYGAHGLWYPTQDAKDVGGTEWGESIPWWEALARPGGEQMGHMRRCYESVRWWLLEPWPAAISVAGEASPGAMPLAKGASDPLQVVVFFPSERDAVAGYALTLPMKRMTVLAGRWFDPRTGKTSQVDGNLNVRDSRCDLPKPPDNRDWVLILSD